MNILIIYTYPNHQSFNYTILKAVQENLSKNHNVNTLDLYEEQFDPPCCDLMTRTSGEI
nr:NAD(P)H-dependent oxidoreductase [Veillonella denticariosi]